MSLDELIPSVTVPEGVSGEWRVERFTVTDDDLRLFNLRQAISGGRRQMRPGTYTRLMRGGTVVMSDTPAEKRDHAYFVRAANGHVLINGLGIGMVLNAVMRKAEVASVTVVEASEDVIRLVAPHYPEANIVHGDAMTWRPPVGVRYGAVWHDIWDDICADNLDEMKTLHRRYGRKSDWQGSWCRELCERQAA